MSFVLNEHKRCDPFRPLDIAGLAAMREAQLQGGAEEGDSSLPTGANQMHGPVPAVQPTRATIQEGALCMKTFTRKSSFDTAPDLPRATRGSQKGESNWTRAARGVRTGGTSVWGRAGVEPQAVAPPAPLLRLAMVG